MLKTTSRFLNKAPAARVERGNTILLEFCTYQFDAEEEEWALVEPDEISFTLQRRGSEVESGLSYAEAETGIYQVAVRLVTVGEYTVTFAWSLETETTTAVENLDCVLHIEKGLHEVGE